MRPEASDFFHDSTNSPAMSSSDMKTAKSYKRCFKESKQAPHSQCPRVDRFEGMIWVNAT